MSFRYGLSRACLGETITLIQNIWGKDFFRYRPECLDLQQLTVWSAEKRRVDPLAVGAVRKRRSLSV